MELVPDRRRQRIPSRVKQLSGVSRQFSERGVDARV
jgi:hypothetical protein